jgi:hypothetical protein
MGFIPKAFLRALWGVSEEDDTMTPPLDCEACGRARIEGRDACDEHHHAHGHRSSSRMRIERDTR